VELFTDNEPMRQYLRRDPCRLMRATARFLYVSRCLDRMLTRAPAGRLKLPVTLILAERDRIIDNAATRNVLDRLAGDHLRVRELPGSHTLEFECDPTPLWSQLLAATRLGEPPGPDRA